VLVCLTIYALVLCPISIRFSRWVDTLVGYYHRHYTIIIQSLQSFETETHQILLRALKQKFIKFFEYWNQFDFKL